MSNEAQVKLIEKSYAVIGKAVVDILTTIPYVKKMRKFKSRNALHSDHNYTLVDGSIFAQPDHRRVYS